MEVFYEPIELEICDEESKNLGGTNWSENQNFSKSQDLHELSKLSKLKHQ